MSGRKRRRVRRRSRASKSGRRVARRGRSARSSKASKGASYPHRLLAAMRVFLHPLLPGGKRGKGGGKVAWAPLLLAVAAVLMAWDTAPTLAERFDRARATLRDMFPRAKLGRTYQGLVKALARAGLHVPVAAGLRDRTRAAAGRHWERDGWCAFAADGTKVDCPRTAKNKRAFGRGGRKKSGPQMYLTVLWHMGTGLPWAWEVGRATASER